MKNILIIIVMIFISGCATKQSLSTSSNIKTLCSSKTPIETYESLFKKMCEAYTGDSNQSSYVASGQLYSGIPGVMISTPSGIYIETNQYDNQQYEISLSIKNGISPKMYGELITISEGNENCITQINIRYLNFFWERHVELTTKLLAEE
jgi:hypothetical protein